MKHVRCVTQLPRIAKAAQESSGVDVGGIIKGVGGAVASLIVAASLAVGVKSLIDQINPPAR